MKIYIPRSVNDAAFHPAEIHITIGADVRFAGAEYRTALQYSQSLSPELEPAAVKIRVFVLKAGVLYLLTLLLLCLFFSISI